ncbi:hypothetical protein ABZV29_41205 [Streptomyces sp. NPDC005236]|uniref:hypothetical protein n=1 Tax=Streptomyces sp. NPDC005236 TaxID=3157028 RepID=UPI0033A61887
MCAGRQAATATSSVATGSTWSLLHNPERAHPGDRAALHRAMRDAFVVLEGEAAAGNVAGYGVATWAGLEEEAFTVGELLVLETTDTPWAGGWLTAGDADWGLYVPVRRDLVTGVVLAEVRVTTPRQP